VQENLADLAIIVIHRRRQGGMTQCYGQPGKQDGDEDRRGAAGRRRVRRQQAGSYVSNG